jgi:hypothetical protein
MIWYSHHWSRSHSKEYLLDETQKAIPSLQTSKDTTDTFIEQEQFTDSSGKAHSKRIVYRYMLMNNPIDF